MKKEAVFRLALTIVIFILVYEFGVKPYMGSLSGRQDSSWVSSKLQKAGDSYDVVVVGDEPEGFAAALSSSRLGARTLWLLEGEDVSGAVGKGLYADLGVSLGPKKELLNQGIIKELRQIAGEDFSPQKYKKAEEKMLKGSKNLDVILGAKFESLEVRSGNIASLAASVTNEKNTIRGKYFIDATKDGTLLEAAGVPYISGSEDLNLKKSFMPVRLNFEISGVEWSDIKKATEPKNTKFYAKLKEYTPAHIKIRINNFKAVNQGDGKIIIQGLEISDLDVTNKAALQKAYEEAVDEAVLFTDFLQRGIKEFNRAKFSREAESFIIKENRHFKGEHVLSVTEVLENTNFKDKLALGSNPVYGDKFTSMPGYIIGKPDMYSIPMGTIIPLKIDNLLMVGSKISYSSLAASSAGCMAINMTVGEGAGIVAAYAAVKNITPRAMVSGKNIDILKELVDLMKKQGMYLPEFRIENKNSEHWSYAALKQLLSLGLLAGGPENNYNFNKEALQQDFRTLLLNGIYRVDANKYSLGLETRLRPYAVSEKLTVEKAGEMVNALYDIKYPAGKAFETAAAKGYFNEILMLRLKDKKILTMDDLYYLSAYVIKHFTGKDIQD